MEVCQTYHAFRIAHIRKKKIQISPYTKTKHFPLSNSLRAACRIFKIFPAPKIFDNLLFGTELQIVAELMSTRPLPITCLTESVYCLHFPLVYNGIRYVLQHRTTRLISGTCLILAISPLSPEILLALNKPSFRA